MTFKKTLCNVSHHAAFRHPQTKEEIEYTYGVKGQGVNRSLYKKDPNIRNGEWWPIEEDERLLLFNDPNLEVEVLYYL